MCMLKRTIYTICAHAIDETLQRCPSQNIRRRLHISRTFNHPCMWMQHGPCQLALGWCPDCKRHIKKANERGLHPREIYYRDKHIISNFWAFRSHATNKCVEPVPTKKIPLLAIDGAERLKYKRTSTQFDRTWLQYLHWYLKEGSPYNWDLFDILADPREPKHLRADWCLFNVPPAFAHIDCERTRMREVPSIPMKIGRADGVRYIPFEQYAILFAIYEFRASNVTPDPLSAARNGVAGEVHPSRVIDLIAGACNDTMTLYAVKMDRDDEMVRAQDMAEERARNRNNGRTRGGR